MLFCHGTPGSRLFRPAEPTLLSEIDVDLVTVDRLGYGQSTAQPGRTLLDWPREVAALADELGWRHFAVAGISGGGPTPWPAAARCPNGSPQSALFPAWRRSGRAPCRECW